MGALTRTCFRLIIAAVGLLTAMSLATLTRRIISTVPSAAFGTGRRLAGEHGAGGVLGVDGVVLARAAAGRGGWVRITSMTPMLRGGDRGGQPGAVGAGALDPSEPHRPSAAQSISSS